MVQEILWEGVELAFGDEKFTVPVSYKEMLSTWYGNFMELPPEEQQLPHHKYTFVEFLTVWI